MKSGQGLRVTIALMCAFLLLLLTACASTPVTRYQTITVDRYVAVPPVLTQPLRVPRPGGGMTYGQCVSDYAPSLLEVLEQANRDRAALRELSGALVNETD